MIRIPYTSRLTPMNQTDQINQIDQTDEICQMWRPDPLTPYIFRRGRKATARFHLHHPKLSVLRARFGEGGQVPLRNVVMTSCCAHGSSAV